MNLAVIYIIAKNTFREIIRDRILIGLGIFVLLLILMSIALGQLTFAEQAKISMDFVLSASQLSLVFLSMILGSSLVAREIDKRTLLTLLVKPVTRAEFLAGKAFGLVGVIALLVLCLSLVVLLIASQLEIKDLGEVGLALVGIFLEGVLLLSVSLFFSTWTRPFMVISFCIGFFLIGHWIDTLKMLKEKSENPLFIALADGVIAVFPNLERLNWRSLFMVEETLSLSHFGMVLLWVIVWSLFFLSSAHLAFRKRDLS